MATRPKQPAAPSQKGIVHIRIERSYGGDKVQMTSHGRPGCFLEDRDQEASSCRCFTIRDKEIKANPCHLTVVGLNGKLKHDVILADLKKKLRCNGRIETEEAGKVIRLETGRTEAVKQFLLQSGLAAKDKIRCTPTPSV